MKKNVYLFGLLCVLPFAVVAQQPAGEVGTVVITPHIDAPLDTSTAQAYVLTGAQLQRQQIETVAQALRTVPGTSLSQSGPYGGIASVRLRGGLSEQTLVMIDGVPVNDVTSPGGGYDFGRLSTDGIDRIEVLSGPQSAAFGTDAISGVVNIISKKPKPGRSGVVDVYAGGANQIGGQVTYSTAHEKGGIRMTASASDADGISRADERDGNTEKDRFQHRALRVSGHHDLGTKTTLQAHYHGQTARSDEDGSGGATGVVDADVKSRVEEHEVAATLTTQVDNDRQVKLHIFGAQLARDNTTSGTPSFWADGRRVGARLNGQQTKGAHTVVLGVDGERRTYKTQFDSLRQRDRAGVFATTRSQLSANTTVDTGIRYGHDTEFGGNVTGNIGVHHQLNTDWAVRMRAASGYKAPTLFQETFFCCGATAPNRDLDNETVVSVDAGIQGTMKNTDVGLDVFWQRTDDMIDFVFANGVYENIDRVRSFGATATFARAVMNHWLLSGDVTFTQADDRVADTRLARTPRYTGNIHITYLPDQPWSAGLDIHARSDSRDSFGTAAGFVRANLRGQVDVTDTLEVYGRVDNLTDEQYQEVFGYGTPGREAFVGVRKRF